ncbi:MAG: hypothetical protein WDW38_007450 [Sanguina aurantia]
MNAKGTARAATACMPEPREGWTITTMPHPGRPHPGRPPNFPPTKGPSTLMHQRTLQALAVARASPLPAPSLALYVLSTPAQLADLCARLNSAGRPVSLALRGPSDPSAAEAGPAAQPHCLSLSWSDATQYDASPSQSPHSAASTLTISCAVLPLPLGTGPSPGQAQHPALTAALTALQPLLTPGVHASSPPSLADPLMPSASLPPPAASAATQQPPLLMTFDSKQLHRLLLEKSLPPAGLHVTDTLMAAYLLDSHLNVSLHDTTRRHGLPYASDLMRAVIDAAPAAQQLVGRETAAPREAVVLRWEVPLEQRARLQAAAVAPSSRASGSFSAATFGSIEAHFRQLDTSTAARGADAEEFGARRP